MAILLLQTLLLLANVVIDPLGYKAHSTPPPRLQPPIFVSNSSTTISVRWEPVHEDGGSPVLGYALHGGVAGGPLRPLYDSLAATSADPMRRNYTARGLWPDTVYAFKVAQTNEVGRSEWSEIAEFSTTAVTPIVSSAVPLAGPRAGGTRVTVRGADLAFGRVYTCKFGETWVPATRTAMEKPTVAAASIVEKWSAEAADAAASGDAADGRATIECYTPRSPMRNSFTPTGEPLQLSAVPTLVTIGYDHLGVPMHPDPYKRAYAPSSVDFTFYHNPEPTTFTPQSGPLAGGTSVTVTGSFPRLLYYREHQETAGTFPEASCTFAGAIVPAYVLPLNESHVAEAEAYLTLDAPPPPSLPPGPPGSNGTNWTYPPSPPNPPPPPPPDPYPPISPPYTNESNYSLSPPGYPPVPPASPAPAPQPPKDMVERTLICTSPHIGAGFLKRTLLQQFSFGEASDAVAGLREYGRYNPRGFEQQSNLEYLHSLRRSMVEATAAERLRHAAEVAAEEARTGDVWPRWDWADDDEMFQWRSTIPGDAVARADLPEWLFGAGSGMRDDEADHRYDGGTEEEEDEVGYESFGDRWDAGEGAAASIEIPSLRESGEPLGFVLISGVSTRASSEQPGDTHLATFTIGDGLGMSVSDEKHGQRVHALCEGESNQGCAGQCWRSDVEKNPDEQWIQYDFGLYPRHIDMIQLYGFNSPHSADQYESLLTADVQIPDPNAPCEPFRPKRDCGWRTVGRLQNLPMAPARDGDHGINARREGIPYYFVPYRHRHGSHLQSYPWLGFATRSLRFANLVNHRQSEIETPFGLCQVMFYEEDPSASIQLIGTASVRGRMLQLTPGDAFAHLAAESDVYLPSTLGDVALDASARDMRARLARAARVRTSEPNRGYQHHEPVRHAPAGSDENAPIFRRYGETLEAFDIRRNETILARGGDLEEYFRRENAREGGGGSCAADGSSSGGGGGGGARSGGGGGTGGGGGGGRSVELQGSMNALGELTLETTQTDGAGFAGGHGQLPRSRAYDHPNARPRNLDLASRERLGGAWDGRGAQERYVEEEEEEEGQYIPRTQGESMTLDWWWPEEEEEERLPDNSTGGFVRTRTRLEEIAYESNVAKLPPRPPPRGEAPGEYGLDDGERLRRAYDRELEEEEEQVECAGDNAAAAGGGNPRGGEPGRGAWRLTPAGWLPDASDIYPATDAINARTNCRWKTADGNTRGSSRFPSKVRETERNKNISKPLLVGLAYYPFPDTGVPLTYFDVSFDVFVGAAQPTEREAVTRERPEGGDGSEDGEGGGGGLWICYSDIDPSKLADILRPTDGLRTKSHAGSGMCALMRQPSGPDPHSGGRLAGIVYQDELIAVRSPIFMRSNCWLPLSMHVTPQGVSLVHNYRTLLSNVPLPNWSPGIHWRLTLIALTESVPGDAYWIDNLRVTSASLLPNVPRAEFEVSLNGQDFVGNFSFAYHAEPFVDGISPPDGPLSGSTYVTVRGSKFKHGSDYRCLFGNVSVPATLDSTSKGTRMACTSPAAATMWAEPMPTQPHLAWFVPNGTVLPFAVAFNGQNYYGDTTQAFTYHGSLMLSTVLPVSGPTVGGIPLNVTGGRLRGGTAYRCCVVAEQAACDPSGPSVTTATYNAILDQIQCKCPPMFNGGGAYQLRISLNGAQFSFEPYQTLGFWALEPDEETPLTTNRIFPAAGPYLGGTSVGVFFSPIVFEPNTPDNLFGFDEMFAAVGEGSAFANRATLMLKPRCKFGTAVVPAVLASPAKFECTAPTAIQAGAVLISQPVTANELLTAMSLHGGASPYGALGALALTGPGAGVNESGCAVFLRPPTGVPITSLLSIDPEVHHYKQSTTPLHALQFSCGISFASLGMTDGFSVSYGANLGYEGGWGGGNGLRVYIRPYEREVHAWLGSSHLGFGTIPIADLQVEWAHALPLFLPSHPPSFLLTPSPPHHRGMLPYTITGRGHTYI